MKRGDTMSNSLEIKSIAYNGEEITKRDLMLYLNQMITLNEKARQWLEHDSKEYQARIDAVYLERKRRTYCERVVEKPTGLAALSSSKRQEYRKWLKEAPEREKERQKFEAEEDARQAEIEKRLQVLEAERKAGSLEARANAEKFMHVCLQQIIPPAYRKDDIPKILFLYLFNGRAHTLENAINLYHQELHYQKMQEIANEQVKQARADHYAQMQAIQEAAAERRAALNEMKEEISSARRSIENIEFNSEMLFWMNLLD